MSSPMKMGKPVFECKQCTDGIRLRFTSINCVPVLVVFFFTGRGFSVKSLFVVLLDLFVFGLLAFWTVKYFDLQINLENYTVESKTGKWPIIFLFSRLSFRIVFLFNTDQQFFYMFCQKINLCLFILQPLPIMTFCSGSGRLPFHLSG